jgi:hypothetical protein
MKLFSHPSHRRWIASRRFPHSHRLDDYGVNHSETFNVPGWAKKNAEVGQTSLPTTR